MQQAQQKQLVVLLDELIAVIEELLLAGLTTASKSTVERLDVSFKEASRMQLLRLGSTLRIANEEVSRFTKGSAQFSAKRLSFFLGRAWLLASSMKQAIVKGDAAALDRLMATATTAGAERIKVVTIGVTKRVVPGAFAGFDFRLRVVEGGSGLAAGEAMVWSCIFPMRQDLELPAEAFLHLPQKQKFKPSLFLEKKTIEISKCGYSKQATSATRLVMGEATQVSAKEAFTDWSSLWKWDARAAAGRVDASKATPLDLDIELQEEVFLDRWEPGVKKETEEGYDLLPMVSQGLPLEARLDRGPSGVPLLGVMMKLAQQKKARPALYGLMHYEACRMVLQPLTALGQEGPEYLTVSPDKISQAELVKAMKFT